MDEELFDALLSEDDEASSYVLIPDPEEPGIYVAVFNDGSYAKWTPADAVF